MDFLGLKTLTVISDAEESLKRIHNLPDFDIEKVTLEDKKTFELLNQGQTVGVFQLESGGMQALCKQIGLSAFEEIIALVALYRPGPMQFIPQTWQRFGTDATDDGVADPHNIYDAAQSTAEYLCASAPEVESKLGRTDALLTYNQSAEYGELVLERTEGYARIQLLFMKVPRTFLAAG